MSLIAESCDHRDTHGPIVPMGGHTHPLDTPLDELQDRYQVMRDAATLYEDVAAVVREIKLMQLTLRTRPCSLCRERCAYCGGA